jgi:S1-C subfamily serine protease
MMISTVLLFLASQIPVSAPGSPVQSPGGSGGIASASVVKIVCRNTGVTGTGFLHKSGRIITAAHVLDCTVDNLQVIAGRQQLGVLESVKDEVIDLGVLTLKGKLNVPTLPLKQKGDVRIGEVLDIWGFPAGYGGDVPLLTVGYLAGVDSQQRNGNNVPRLIVNAAFNSGNSGGPVIDATDNTVVGVVVTKLAPIPQDIEAMLGALSEPSVSLTNYVVTRPDGSKFQLSQGQAIAAVLQYLRSQTQLVLGQAVMVGDINNFLVKQKIEP